MHKDTLYGLFARYLVGEADHEEIEKLQKRLDASEENKAFFYHVTAFWDYELDYFKKDSERIARELAQRIEESGQEQHQEHFVEFNHTDSVKSKTNIVFSLKIAAVVALFIIAGATLFFSGYLNRRIDPVGTETGFRYVERETRSGEKLNIRLPDGSLVKLNINSKLIFPEHFSEEERKVTLIGEAFFEVAEEAERPFSIKSGDISTTVLGTTFNIRAFPDEKDITVAVVSGSVVVESSNRKSKAIFLDPDEMAIYTKKNDQAVKTAFNYMETIAWKDGIIYFKDANIYRIFETLEDWYGVSFKIDRELNRKKGFTVSYKEMPLEAILEGLSFSYGFQFQINEKTVHIN